LTRNVRAARASTCLATQTRKGRPSIDISDETGTGESLQTRIDDAVAHGGAVRADSPPFTPTASTALWPALAFISLVTFVSSQIR
jgi:hypothetical protein